MLITSDESLLDACRTCAAEGRALVAELPAGDPLLTTLRETWALCRQALHDMRRCAPSAALAFLACCFACDAFADECETRPDDRSRSCAAAFRRRALVCWDLAGQPEYHMA